MEVAVVALVAIKSTAVVVTVFAAITIFPDPPPAVITVE